MSKIFGFLKSHKILTLLGLFGLFSLSDFGKEIAIFTALSEASSIYSLVLIYAAPAFLIAFLAFIISRISGLKWYFATPLALVLLAIPAFILNQNSNSKIDALLASDVDKIELPLNIKTLAYIDNRGFGGAPACDDFCARALLTQEFDKIIVANWQAMPPSGQLNIMGTAFWLEQTDFCDVPEFDPNLNKLKFINADEYSYQEQPVNRLDLAAVQGNCLLHEETNLNQADATLVYGVFQRGQTEFEAGLDIFAQSVNADRLSFYQKRGDKMTLQYQATAAQNVKFAPLLLPYLSLDNFAAKLAFKRLDNFDSGTESGSHVEVPLATFLLDKLKLDLEVETPETGEQYSEVLIRMSSATGKISPARLKLAEQQFQSVEAQVEYHHPRIWMVYFLLENRNVPISIHTSNLSMNEAHGTPELVPKIAKTLFERLDEFKTQPEIIDNQELIYIGNALGLLPPYAFEPHYETLKSLATNRRKRIYLGPVLAHLADMGDQALPSLFELLDEANRQTYSDKFSDIRWENMYQASLSGLCKLATTSTDKQAIATALYQRLDAGELALFGSHWSKIIHLFLALNVEPDEIWNQLQKVEDDHDRASFDDHINRAKQKIDCGWYG